MGVVVKGVEVNLCLELTKMVDGMARVEERETLLFVGERGCV